MFELITWRIAIPVTVILTALLHDPIQRLSTRLLSGFPSGQKLSLRGNWLSEYSYINSENRRVDSQQEMKITQFGSRLVAISTKNNGRHIHDIVALVDGNIVTGRWINVAAGSRQHGSFQLVVEPDGKRMIGRWIGLDKRAKVQQGEWIWTKLSDQARLAQLPQ